MSVRTKIKQYGWNKSLHRFVKYLLRKAGIHYESYWLMVNQLSKQRIKLKMQKFDYSDVKELTFEDFKKGDPRVFDNAKLKLIKSRFENGDYWSHGIFDNSKLIYSGWITTGKIHYPTKFYKSTPLSHNEGFNQDVYCDTNYRRRGLDSKMILYRLLKLHELGRNKIITIILTDNMPAYRGLIKSGFKIEKKIRFFKIFSKMYCIEKTW